MGHALTLTESLATTLGESAPDIRPGDWEVGRLVLAPSYRTDVDSLRHCLHLALEYARAHAHVSRLFAACTPVLSRLYRRFAFSVYARDVPLAGTPKTYTLIFGAFDDVGRALAERPTASVR
jgi:hypothetical protein